MASSFGAILGRMARVPGIVAAIVMTVDGSITEQSVAKGVDPQPVRAMARDLLSRWAWVGSDMGMGRPRALLSASARGPLSVMPVGPDAVLLAMGNSSCSIGRIRHEMRRAGDAIREAPHAPGTTIPDLQRMISEKTSTNGAAQRVRTIERDSDEQPDAPPAGEIVVIGVNTFRLAQKLVTALARVPGVRSASLKMYAPGSITIDVAFEGRGTLASIPLGSFGDWPLEVIDRTDARLVLGVATPVVPAAYCPGAPP